MTTYLAVPSIASSTFLYLYQLRSDLGVEGFVIISMMVICYASDIIENDGRRSGLSNAPLDGRYDNQDT